MALEQYEGWETEEIKDKGDKTNKDQPQPGVGNPDITGRELGLANFFEKVLEI